MKTRPATAIFVLAAVLAGGALAGCAAAEPSNAGTKGPAYVDEVSLDQAATPDDTAFDQTIAHLAERISNVDAVWWDEHLSEALPNTKFSVDGAAARSAYAAAVEGTVVAVSEGASYRAHIGDEGISEIEKLPFDSPGAQWRVMILTLQVADDFGTALPATIEFGMTIGTGFDAEIVREAFEGGHIFAVLEERDPSDDVQYALARAQTLIGSIDDDGTLSLPVLGDGQSSYLDGLTSLDAVREAATEPPTVIELTADGVRPTA
ncbi:hypothetical protein [Microbacterium sp. PMB16]|uniref:hypothetical protein n=1 Tax=Microbacterium sp. PMB16 TaxID=3120157 RepID=UPI003F4B92B9